MPNETKAERDARLQLEKEEQERVDEESRIREQEQRDLDDARAADAAERGGTAPVEAAKHIYVVSTLAAKPDGGSQVALFETDSAHPGGQAMIAGPVPVKVAATAGVSQAIHEGRAREVSVGEAKRLTAEYDEQRAKARTEARAQEPSLAAQVADELESRIRR